MAQIKLSQASLLVGASSPANAELEIGSTNLATAFKEDFGKSTSKYDVLRNLDFFVLDNSIRESTVGQLRGHTLENKWAIYNEVKKMGFKDVVVASFSHMTRIDDAFVKELMEKVEDRSGLWAFSEITEGRLCFGSLLIFNLYVSSDITRNDYGLP